jgi:hypothetical protein
LSWEGLLLTLLNIQRVSAIVFFVLPLQGSGFNVINIIPVELPNLFRQLSPWETIVVSGRNGEVRITVLRGVSALLRDEVVNAYEGLIESVVTIDHVVRPAWASLLQILEAAWGPEDR